MVGDIVCPRCIWERSVSGPEAGTLLAIVLRAHVEVCHPGFLDEPGATFPASTASRSQRPGLVSADAYRHRHR